jgi:hypothetical protein
MKTFMGNFIKHFEYDNGTKQNDSYILLMGWNTI